MDSSIVPPGFVSAARNVRFRNGKAETRRGILKLNWTTLLGDSWPWVFPVTWEKRIWFNTIYGAGRFDDPNGVEWLVIAASSVYGVAQVWVTRPNNVLVEEPLPDGENITGPCKFVQAFNKLFLFRGDDDAPLVLESAGTGVGFRALEEAEEGTGLELIPNASDALWIQNRLVIPHDRDLVSVSDINDPEHVYAALNQFRINQGSSDRLVGVYKLTEDAIICVKESSIYVISSLTPDASGRWSSARVEELTSSFGFVAGGSVVNVGADLIGLSKLGVMSVRQTELGKAQGQQIPLSAAIEPLIGRINWAYASNARGAYWDSKYYLAVPLDRAERERNDITPANLTYVAATDLLMFGLEPGRKYRVYFGEQDLTVQVNGEGTVYNPDDDMVFEFTASNPPGAVPIYTQPYLVLRGKGGKPVTLEVVELFQGINNAVLVYDFLTQTWQGYDDGEAVMVQDWVKMTVDGEEVLLFTSPDGFLNLYEGSFAQDDGVEWYGYTGAPPLTKPNLVTRREIETEIVTRGYGNRAGVTDVEPSQEQWKTRKTAGEVRMCEACVSMRTWNPTYSIYERPDGVNEEVTRVSAKTRSRTRYDQWNKAAWVQTNENDDHGTARREDYSVSLVAGGFELGSGINFERLQDVVERVKLHERGGVVQLRILNAQGRMELTGVEVVGMGGRRGFGALV